MAANNKQDYYQTLGVKKDATAEEIKKAYRRLARKHHPDVNPGDKSAEDRFKKITEAHDILSDPKKRRIFDKFGYYSDNLSEADLNNPFAGAGRGGAGANAQGFDFSGFNWENAGGANPGAAGASGGFSDIFETLFGRGKTTTREAAEPLPRPLPKKGEDIEMPLALSFEEAVTGLTTNITVNRSVQCSRCQGAGDTGGAVITCPTCHGAGKVQRMGGRLEFSQTCPDCEGTGKRRQPCGLCNGKGVVPLTEQVKVRIPPGVETGSRVRVAGKGQGGRLGAPAGDLFIVTRVGEHQFFTRKGDNIYVTIPITVPEAALGAKIEVPTVEGKAQLKIPPGTQSGQKFRLRERGFPSLRNQKLRGDQFVEVQITLPKVISEETKEILRQFEHSNAENPRKIMGLE
ncbi:MAG: molecular chaperone DnaJ [Pyrinomonadaceae bacterium]